MKNCVCVLTILFLKHKRKNYKINIMKIRITKNKFRNSKFIFKKNLQNFILIYFKNFISIILFL
jgi:hypothetical protein